MKRVWISLTTLAVLALLGWGIYAGVASSRRSAEVKTFATNFVQDYGTYNYRNFSTYAEQMRSRMTPELWSDLFNPEFLPKRTAYQEVSQFSATTKATSSKIRSRQSDSAIVEVLASADTVASGKESLRSQTIRLTLSRSSEGWRVSRYEVIGG